MYNVKLIKLNTLDDAEYPQKEKYPDNTIKEGETENLPIVGQSFSLYKKSKIGFFVTSPVTKIISNSDKEIIFTTLNSKYKLEIDEFKEETILVALRLSEYEALTKGYKDLCTSCQEEVWVSDTSIETIYELTKNVDFKILCQNCFIEKKEKNLENMKIKIGKSQIKELVELLKNKKI